MGGMIVSITNTSMVQPSQETAKRRLWVSNVDLVVSRAHITNIYFYRSNNTSLGFLDPNLLKEALSRVLIPYYPVAGRLMRDTKSRRIEIDCNEEGVLFVEAGTNSIVNDFGEFAPTTENEKLIPKVDYSGGISSFPLLLVQLTYFKCGGVSLGVAMHRLFADGFSRTLFINTWAAMARGLDPTSTTSPSIDRSFLRARDPPLPMFHHVEYEPSPTLLKPRRMSCTTSTRAFTITRDQINALKAANSKKDGNGKIYTSFEILASHIWICVCKARGLSDMQLSKLYIPVDSRSRLQPNLPPMYFGNAVFIASSMSTVGDLVSNPASYAAHKIHESVHMMNDDYLKSALDYIELQLDKDVLVRESHTYACPNLTITNWAKLPIYDADFGWGKPAFVGPGGMNKEGLCHFVPRAVNDGGLSIAITLEAKCMELFETYFYRI